MRISDWSSDVCSSDLAHVFERRICCGGRACRHDAGDPGIDGADQQDHSPAGACSGLLQRWLVPPDRSSVNRRHGRSRSEEHTSELQSLMRISYAVFCLHKKSASDHTQRISHVLTTNTTATHITICTHRTDIYKTQHTT